jgi:hypothetical protein
MRVWANLRQRALDTAMTEITKKADISIEIESLERSTSAGNVGDVGHQGASSAGRLVKGKSAG